MLWATVFQSFSWTWVEGTPMVALVSAPPEMETSVIAKVTVLEVTPWAVPLTHPEPLALRVLVAAVAAIDAPDGALVTNASPPNRQAASGTAIACLNREDLRTLDNLI